MIRCEQRLLRDRGFGHRVEHLEKGLEAFVGSRLAAYDLRAYAARPILARLDAHDLDFEREVKRCVEIKLHIKALADGGREIRGRIAFDIEIKAHPQLT